MNMTVVLVCAGIALCIVLSHFFSSAEMSYSSANVLRLENEAENGPSSAKAAYYIVTHFDQALSTILIGNNLVNNAASALTSVFVLLVTGSDAKTWIGTLVITILIIVFGETIAKMIAKRKPNTLSLAYALPIRVLMVVLFPVVWVVAGITERLTASMNKKQEDEEDEEEKVEAFASIIETAEDEGVLDTDRTELLQKAISFSNTCAYEVATSRVDMDALDVDTPQEELLAFAEKTTHSRIPVYEESIDQIIGVIHVNHLLKGLCGSEHMKLRSILLTPCFVYKTTKLPEVLDQLKKARQHLAVVTDEYGGTAGVITMEDVMEELVGEIWDESDEVEESVVKMSDHEYEVDGDMNLFDFLERAGMAGEEEEFESETVGGWCIEQLGHYPREGETFSFGALQIRILEMDDLRVEKIRVVVDR
ncbi:MAG: HlyC/CorC family transporter [Lachnospiraceae bacterium]|nr:HlyC/CorC family transporter [Lachnospiraceae bacterium]